jgi:hypothetical protein
MCPSLGLPNLGKLSSCGQTCVLSAIKSNRCDNPLDQSCMCGLKGISLAANAGLCVLFRGCGFFTNIRDLISATLVQLGQCTRRSRRAIEDKNMSYAPRDLVEHWELQQERTIGEIFRRGAVDARAVAELERAINELAARM